MKIRLKSHVYVYACILVGANHVLYMLDTCALCTTHFTIVNREDLAGCLDFFHCECTNGVYMISFLCVFTIGLSKTTNLTCLSPQVRLGQARRLRPVRNKTNKRLDTTSQSCSWTDTLDHSTGFDLVGSQQIISECDCCRRNCCNGSKVGGT